MKLKIVLITILLTFTTLLIGQDFGTIGTQWYYSEHAGGRAPSNSEYLHLKSVSDTIIHGKKTHKIIRTYYKYNDDTVKFDPLYIYQQTDTVFMYNSQKAKFQSIYIFNAQKGDTLTLEFPEPIPWSSDSTYRLVIDTVETLIVKGISLKLYRTIALDRHQFHDGGYYMDRIGGLDWFFPRPDIIPEAGGPIRCYSDNQIDTSFQSIKCDYRSFSSINETKTNFKINVFPNPVQNEITIQSKQPITRIELNDITGKRIITTNQLNLNLNYLNNGLYILTIYFNSGKQFNKKIIKNTL